MSLDLQDDDAWSPIAKHGDSPDKVRAAIERLQGQTLNRGRNTMRELGVPESRINELAVFLERRMTDDLENNLEQIMADLARTAS